MSDLRNLCLNCKLPLDEVRGVMEAGTWVEYCARCGQPCDQSAADALRAEDRGWLVSGP